MPALTFGVLLVRVRHRDLPVGQVLPIHALDGCITRLKAVKAHKAKALAVACAAAAAAAAAAAEESRQ
jgi:hypothetical protein